MPANLTRTQQKQIKAVVDRAKKDNGVPQTAQQSIPFQRMFPDGVCRVTDNYYTKTIQFQDINYQLAQQEDKTAIFDEWCSFLNFFDSSIHFELSFMNMSTDAESFEKSIRIPYRKDDFNQIRAEYSQMLRKQLAQGNNGLTKTKFLTFGIEADSMKQAKPRLNHIENDLLNNFRRLGVVAHTLNGKERLHLMHSMFHMGDNDKFIFDWKWLVNSGLSVKDFIAPTSFAFKGSRTFQMGSLYGAMSYLAITASDLSDRMLADFLDMESSQIVTMHTPLDDTTRGMADEEFFMLMQPGAIFINASRGEVMNEDALKAAYPKLGAAIIDTWNNEPDVDEDLIELVDVATPHIAGYSFQGKQNGTASAVQSVAHHFGIEELYDYYPENDIPDHEPKLLDLKDKKQGEIAALFQYNYPVFTDDFRFRMEPENFEKMRSAYQYRKEICIEGLQINTNK